MKNKWILHVSLMALPVLAVAQPTPIPIDHSDHDHPIQSDQSIADTEVDHSFADAVKEHSRVEQVDRMRYTEAVKDHFREQAIAKQSISVPLMAESSENGASAEPSFSLVTVPDMPMSDHAQTYAAIERMCQKRDRGVSNSDLSKDFARIEDTQRWEDEGFYTAYVESQGPELQNLLESKASGVSPFETQKVTDYPMVEESAPEAFDTLIEALCVNSRLLENSRKGAES